MLSHWNSLHMCIVHTHVLLPFLKKIIQKGELYKKTSEDYIHIFYIPTSFKNVDVHWHRVCERQLFLGSFWL